MIVGYIASTATEPKHIHRSVLCRRLEDSPKLTEVEATSSERAGDAEQFAVLISSKRVLVRICKECANMNPDAGEWMTQGSCARLTSTEATIYTADQPASDPRVVAAKQRCASCPVRHTCLQLGMSQPSGIWGGLTAAERKEMITAEAKARLRRRRLALRASAA